MKTNVYLFTTSNLATAYGVGTYISQLMTCLPDSSIDVTLVDLYAEDQGEEVSVKKAAGHQLITIPTIRGRGESSQKYYARSVAYLLKEFIPAEEEPYSIFHLNLMSEPYLATYLKELFKCKIVLTVHYTNWSFLLAGRFEELEKILGKGPEEHSAFEAEIVKSVTADGHMIRQCDKVICIAEHSYQSLIRLYQLPENKVCLIPNAIKESYKRLPEKRKATIKKRFTIETDTRVILFAGRLTEVKGMYPLLKAFKKVIETIPSAHLFIAGDGSFAPWLQESRTYSTKASFMGKLSKEELYDFYRIADLGVVPSLHEEFGLVALEMMMHEVPLIVSDTSGLSEIIGSSGAAIKIPVKISGNQREPDPKVLARKMSYLLMHKEDATELGRRGRERFLESYEINRFKKEMAQLYRRIIREGQAEGES